MIPESLQQQQNTTDASDKKEKNDYEWAEAPNINFSQVFFLKKQVLHPLIYFNIVIHFRF